jgi:NAD(P)H-quinone oxidoreductase subunit 4
VLLKLGTYGLLRFGLGLLPEAWQAIAPFLAGWAVVSVIYGCLTAINQTDMKKMVAYSSVGHMGYILLALAAATPLSLVGATFQMVSHGLISALLFILVGIVYKKTGTRNINSLNGLLNPERGLPVTGSLMILAAMASAGTPGMVGFIAEFVIFRSSFAVFPVQTLLCMIGTGLTAVYFLIMIDRVFFGRLGVEIGANQALISEFPFAKWQERFPAIALALIIVFFGLLPNFATGLIENSAKAIAPNQTKLANLSD